MTSKSPSNSFKDQSFKDIESDADALMDELFRDVEESFSAQTALPEGDGAPANSHQSPTSRASSKQRSRPSGIPWVAIAVGGLAAVSSTVLWWSYVHLPKRLAILSGQGSDGSSMVASSGVAGEANTSFSTEETSAPAGTSSADATNANTSAVSDAVEGVVEDAVETSATAASDLVASTPSQNGNSAIADIEVDQAEVDRILAATAPPPVYAPPPAPVAYAPPPPAPAPPPVPEMTLVGVMDGSNGDPVALVMIGNNMRQVAVGETVSGGWRVASISDRSVSITNGAQSEVLGL